jgi:hypothetical protein
MSLNTWHETLITAKVDGPTLTAAARASCIPTGAIITLPNNFFQIGKKIRINANGRISVVITTPGTARFDIAIAAVVAFDSLALNLNIVAKTTVPWNLSIDLTCRAEGTGTSANLMGNGLFVSEAVIAAPLPAVGGNGVLNIPVGTPAVGTGFDSTLANTLNMFFTQTVATGSFTLHQYEVIALN